MINDKMPLIAPSIFTLLNGDTSLEDYRKLLCDTSKVLDDAFLEGADIRPLIAERSHVLDKLLRSVWDKFDLANYPCSLVAVGGYGRGELHPQSDIDILVLCENALDEGFNEKLSQFITLLWDIGLKVGHAVRTLEQASELAQSDTSVITNLLESRTLCANHQLLAKLKRLCSPEHMWDSKSYFNAKISEQDARHERRANSEFNLEPNVKNAPGGLRDIQTISWVAKRHFGTGSLQSLNRLGILTDSEYSQLNNGEEFLWRVRYGIHLIARRPEERLMVDIQRKLAEIFGYIDSEQALAVEQFMRRYYRWVQTISQLNEVLLQYLRESIFEHESAAQPTVLNRRFKIINGYLSTAHSQVFSRTPSAMLELFSLMGEHEDIKNIRAATIRQLRAHLHLIDEKFRSSKDNSKLFLSIMRGEHNLTRVLERMVRYGVLGKYIPLFDKITGLMQHDLFHKYTVDAHTLLLIKYLRKFYKGEFTEQFPLSSEVIKRIPKIEVLMIAGLFHDIAKGRGGNHSKLGAIDARTFCEQHHLGSWDTELIVWLVERHLFMSGVSQKQDLTDPAVIERFANTVQDKTRLDYLFCLTVADINATNPELWNSWKASLLRQLYIATAKQLDESDSEPANAELWIKDTKHDALELLTEQGFSNSNIESLWSELPNSYFLRESADDIAWHTKHTLNSDGHKPLVLIRDKHDQRALTATMIFIRTKDRRRVFSTITSVFASFGLNIYDARIAVTKNGYAANTFMVLDQNKQTIGKNTQLLEAITTNLSTALSQSELLPYEGTGRASRMQRYFNRDTKIKMSRDASDEYTQLTISAADRPGLLAQISRVFDELDITLHFARISTLGERVEDSFYITDQNNQPIDCPARQQALCNALDKISDQ